MADQYISQLKKLAREAELQVIEYPDGRVLVIGGRRAARPTPLHREERHQPRDEGHVMSRILERALDDERRTACQQHDMQMQRSLRTFTRAARMVTTPTGIVIGIAHTPPPPQPSRDHERIQAALLDERTAKPLPPLLRIFGLLWRST